VSTAANDPALELPLDLPPPAHRSLLGTAWDELRAVVRYRSLVRYLLTSELRTEHRNTVLGFVWWILDPLLLAAVYVLFVGLILGRRQPDFAIFVLTAIIPWAFFSKALRRAMNATVGKERSMRQVAFPKAILPLSSVLAGATRFLFGFVVLVLIAIPFGIYPSFALVLAIPIVLVELVFTLGFAFFFSAFNVFFRDTSEAIGYGIRIWFYLSPALYPVSIVPERFRDIYELNPFATFFPAYRAVVMEHTAPDWAALGILAVVSVVLLAVGYLFFVRAEPWFAKLL
jgi:lipopolysaccharide transport system permease protein